MKKAKRADGAPAYIQLYTTIMILLLAFFIVLTTLSEEQTAGFRDGIGDVKDAFGIRGGIGMLPFHYSDGGMPTTESSSAVKVVKGPKESGVDRELLRGSGGVGISDMECDKGEPRYIRVVVRPGFEPGRAELSPPLAAFLEVSGTVLASHTAYHLVLRQISAETGDATADASLAQRRAVAVLQFLHRRCQVPLQRMTAVGHADSAWLPRALQLDRSDQTQRLVFDLRKTAAGRETDTISN